MDKLNFSELLAIAENCFIDFNSLLDNSGDFPVDRFGHECTDEILIRKSALNYDKLSAYIKILEDIFKKSFGFYD